MRLKKSKNAAEEELVTLINEGYKIADFMNEDYHEKSIHNDFDSGKDNKIYRDMFNEWGNKVVSVLDSIFPTSLESSSFIHTQYTLLGSPGADREWFQQRTNLIEDIKALKRIRDDDLKNYTDLPSQSRLYIQDIDSFRQVRDVNPEMVKAHLKDGYLDMSEDSIQMSLEQILDVSFYRRDWGGEINDLYTANVELYGSKIATAFSLKGKGLKKKVLQIKDCGKNGDQLVRLFESPAQLFIVQFVGEVSDNVIRDVESKVDLLRSRGKSAYFCIMNGQDTAMLLHAYGKL